ncbi:TadE/TadG family type IV pilus assembly protein [Luteibacter yeojuensis]|uniref:TadE-like protein n=1 Tax=Luteibacter yeojuensis TaxID=345309 RepID=A0A0F3L192_9GAMM|nr:TadE family protein [Luteibacter yeojuensis]KJV37305.1 hypothetical protein VI08_00345 [Luteibacter yeojuensis]
MIRTSRHQQRGQSLTEMAIACIVVVPMFLMISLLGKYMHVRHEAQVSARSAAWDAAVSPKLVQSEGGLPSRNVEEARMRLHAYGDGSENLRTSESSPSKLSDPMLRTFAGRELVLASNVKLTAYRNDESPAPATKLLDKLGGLGDAIGLDGIPPDKRGYITAEVNTRSERIRSKEGQALDFLDPLDRIDLDFHGKTVLLADTWDAKGSGENADGEGERDVPRTVRHTIKPLSPSAALPDGLLDGIHDATNIIDKIPLIGTVFGINDWVPGKTAPDIVPADRLVKDARR